MQAAGMAVTARAHGAQTRTPAGAASPAAGQMRIVQAGEPRRTALAEAAAGPGRASPVKAPAAAASQPKAIILIDD